MIVVGKTLIWSSSTTIMEIEYLTGP